LFAELLGVAPGDQIAAIYQQRIAAFRATPPSADWDGAVELDKL
jgi:DNA-binding SARP family transcriptional activator